MYYISIYVYHLTFSSSEMACWRALVKFSSRFSILAFTRRSSAATAAPRSVYTYVCMYR